MNLHRTFHALRGFIAPWLRGFLLRAYVPSCLRAFLRHSPFSIRHSTFGKCHTMALHEKTVLAKRTHLTLPLQSAKLYRMTPDNQSVERERHDNPQWAELSTFTQFAGHAMVRLRYNSVRRIGAPGLPTQGLETSRAHIALNAGRPKCVPEGHRENSPAIYRWVEGARGDSSPVGTAEIDRMA